MQHVTHAKDAWCARYGSCNCKRGKKKKNEVMKKKKERERKVE